MRFYINILIGLIVSVFALELFFQVVPVNSGIRMQETSAERPYSRYLANHEFTYSHGWSLLNARHGKTNREGFVNSPDLDNHGGVLVIGDSFIEAFMLPYEQTLQGRLDAALGGNVRAAAAASNGLADTVALLRHFGPQLRPATAVVFVKPYELALLLNRVADGHNGFKRAGGQIAIEHYPYRESALKSLIIRSALVRYVYYNLKFPYWLKDALKLPWQRPAAAAPQSVSDKAEVMGFYLAELRKAAAGARVILLIDGDRASLYAGKTSAQAKAMRDDVLLFEQLAQQQQLEFIDMLPVFQRDWARNHRRLDYLPVDAHWNDAGHALAAQQVLLLINSKR